MTCLPTSQRSQERSQLYIGYYVFKIQPFKQDEAHEVQLADVWDFFGHENMLYK